ncbi:MAG TPA: ABC transporter ATP-binding protein [Candidatus Limnocylindria bacterium]
MSALVATGLHAGYGPRVVLRGIDLAVRAGELTALVGPNGAGKSTLLRAFAGLLRPARGSVTLDGTEVRAMPRALAASRIAVVPQTFDTLFPFTVREIVALGRTARLGLFGRPSDGDAQAISRAIESLELRSLADRRIDALSGGERQRAVLAMALAQEAEVLLLDEPTAHLDPSHQWSLLVRIAALARDRGVIAIAVLHDLNLATLAERVIVLDGGRVVADGGPESALAQAVVREVFGPGLTVVEMDGRRAILPSERSAHSPSEVLTRREIRP